MISYVYHLMLVVLAVVEIGVHRLHPVYPCLRWTKLLMLHALVIGYSLQEISRLGSSEILWQVLVVLAAFSPMPNEKAAMILFLRTR